MNIDYILNHLFYYSFEVILLQFFIVLFGFIYYTKSVIQIEETQPIRELLKDCKDWLNENLPKIEQEKKKKTLREYLETLVMYWRKEKRKK